MKAVPNEGDCALADGVACELSEHFAAVRAEGAAAERARIMAVIDDPRWAATLRAAMPDEFLVAVRGIR